MNASLRPSIAEAAYNQVNFSLQFSKKREKNIGFIFQSFQLVSELNVEQNIMFPLLLDYEVPPRSVSTPSAT